MKKHFYILLIFSLLSHIIFAQCTVNVDTANISHIACPDGGAVGSAQIIQATYLNYYWQNITNGQTYPLSGGVAYDTGVFIRDNEEFPVVYVGKFEGKISHEVFKPGLKQDDKIVVTASSTAVIVDMPTSRTSILSTT